MIYGYARVSTTDQDLSSQKEELQNAGVPKDNIYSEKFTGTTTNRPKFDELLSKINPNDQLIVVKLDRLARNTREALNIIDKLQKDNVSITILNLGAMGHLDNSSYGQFLTTVLLAVAQMERDMIVERTQTGKEYARKHKPNFRDGRPKSTIHDKIHGVPYEDIYNYVQSHSVRKTAEHYSIAPSSVSKVKNIFKEHATAND